MKRFILLLASALLPPVLLAEVNTKNGNFVFTMQDFVLTAPRTELTLRRSFNSKAAADMGWFGWGWSSPYETTVYSMPDGSVVVRENGTGLMHFYDPVGGVKNHEAGLDALVAAARAKDRLDAKRAARLRANLDASEELRVRTAARLGVSGNPQVGDRWRSRLCGEIQRVAKGWTRTACGDEGVDHFHPAGNLLRSVNAKRDITYHWDGPRLASVVEVDGPAFLFTWNPEGQVASVKASSGDEVRYTYSAGALVRIEGRTIVGERMDFAYDSAHRLTRRTLVDTSKDVVTYDSYGMVSSVVDRQGAKATFTYGGQGNAYWTQVRQYSDTGELVGERKYEFDIAASTTGEHAVNRTLIREGDFEITLNADGTVQVGGPGAERLRREEDAARERVQKLRRDNEKARLEELRRVEEDIRRFNRCVIDASNLEHESTQLNWNADRGNLTRTAARRQWDILERRAGSFDDRCGPGAEFRIDDQTARKLCSHPAYQSRWCDAQ